MTEVKGNWGGKRLGAGRKPKAMRYAPVLDPVEGFIACSSMEIAKSMVKRAIEGDNNAAKYLLDRVLGKPGTQKEPPISDHTMPHNDVFLDAQLIALKNTCKESPNYERVKEEILNDTIEDFTDAVNEIKESCIEEMEEEQQEPIDKIIDITPAMHDENPTKPHLSFPVRQDTIRRQIARRRKRNNRHS